MCSPPPKKKKEKKKNMFTLFFILSSIPSKLASNFCFSETHQRELNPRFQQTHRSSLVSPYHNQMRDNLWRNPQPQGKKCLYLEFFL